VLGDAVLRDHDTANHDTHAIFTPRMFRRMGGLRER